MRFITFLILLLSLAPANGQAEPPASASEPSRTASGIGFETVAEALDALRAMPGVKIEVTKPDAWTVVNGPGNAQ